MEGKRPKDVRVAGLTIGDGHPCFIIAEAGVNHNGSLQLAKELVNAAADAGAHAVKFQTFQADKLIIKSAPKAEYQKATTRAAESQLEMLRRLEMSREMTYAVAEHAKIRNIVFLSTGFDEGSIDLLDEIGVPALKIGSGDITDLPLLEHIGSKRRPVILSTGMSYLAEVELAVETLFNAGCPELALLQCVSSYPADPQAANLRAMQTLKNAFDVPVGFSDHSLGIEVATAAVALGANIIEKHITIDANLPGPDHRVSLTPESFRNMVRTIQTVEASRGDGVKQPTAGEQNVRDISRRSIVAECNIPKGTTITRNMLAFKRPGTGISPAQWKSVVGKAALRDIVSDTLIAFGDIE